MTARRLHSAALLALWLFASSCRSTPPEAPDFGPKKAAEIVKREALDAFDTFLAAAGDRAALRTYHTATQNSRTRAELSAAWTANTHLAGKKADLPQRVFRRAEQDGDWPASPPVGESAYVAGFREAVDQHAGGSR